MDTWLNIVYTGKIYDKQDPAILFKAISELIAEGCFKREDISIDLYGEKLGWIDGEVKKYDLVGVVKQHGRVSHQESIKAQRQARVLWLMRWEDSKEDGVIPLKLYEYMAAMRPVLATGGHRDEVTKIIEGNYLGNCCDTAEEIKQALMGM